MRLVSILAASAISLAAFSAAPASAQVGVEVQVPGAGVRIGEPDYRRHDYARERYRERIDIDDDRDLNSGSCRVKTIEKMRPDGTVVTRQERDCD